MNESFLSSFLGLGQLVALEFVIYLNSMILKNLILLTDHCLMISSMIGIFYMYIKVVLDFKTCALYN